MRPGWAARACGRGRAQCTAVFREPSPHARLCLVPRAAAGRVLVDQPSPCRGATSRTWCSTPRPHARSAERGPEARPVRRMNGPSETADRTAFPPVSVPRQPGFLVCVAPPYFPSARDSAGRIPCRSARQIDPARPPLSVSLPADLPPPAPGQARRGERRRQPSIAARASNRVALEVHRVGTSTIAGHRRAPENAAPSSRHSPFRFPPRATAYRSDGGPSGCSSPVAGPNRPAAWAPIPPRLGGARARRVLHRCRKQGEYRWRFSLSGVFPANRRRRRKAPARHAAAGQGGAPRRSARSSRVPSLACQSRCAAPSTAKVPPPRSESEGKSPSRSRAAEPLKACP